MKIKNFLLFVTVTAVCVPCAYGSHKLPQQSLQLVPGVGLFADIGKRVNQEDRFFCEKIDETYVFGIFDGHNGHEGAEYAKNNFPVFFKEAYGSTLDKMKIALRKIENSDLFKRNERCGTTAILACIDSKKENIFIANVGDSRLLLEKNGTVDFVTEDQKPNRSDEKMRIELSRGTVSFYEGTWRVDCYLAMSRVIGNWFIKRTGHVIADPECFMKQLTPENKFLVIASDGLWDGMNNVDLVKFLTNYNHKVSEKIIAWTLGLKAMEKSKDNVTVMVVNLQKLGLNSVKPDYERIQRS